MGLRDSKLSKNTKDELTAKQARFVQEYLIDLNATQAAIRAGYSKRTAYSQGQRLLKKVEIQKVIQDAKDRRADRTEITQDKVLKNIVRIGGKAEKKEKFGDALKAEEMLARHVKLFSDPEDDGRRDPPNVNYNFITIESGK